MKLSTLKNFQEPMSIASLTRLCTKNAFDVRFDTFLEARLETCQKTTRLNPKNADQSIEK